jgi:hypothetical protein
MPGLLLRSPSGPALCSCKPDRLRSPLPGRLPRRSFRTRTGPCGSTATPPPYVLTCIRSLSRFCMQQPVALVLAERVPCSSLSSQPSLRAAPVNPRPHSRFWDLQMCSTRTRFSHFGTVPFPPPLRTHNLFFPSSSPLLSWRRSTCLLFRSPCLREILHCVFSRLACC